LGIGFQACDDSDINNVISPDKEENIGIRFDQRKELGLSYWADYSMLADIVWSERLEKVPSESTVETSDSMPAILVALVLSGAGIVVFSKKKKDR
jgi:LPXTG-motif cell wall-anchored protein